MSRGGEGRRRIDLGRPDRELVLLVAGLAVKAALLVLAVRGPGWAALVAAPAALPLATLALAPGLLLHGRRRTAYLLLSATVISTTLLADLVYARAFGRLPSITMLTSGASYEGLGSSVLALLRPTDPLFFLDVVVVALLALRRRRKLRAVSPVRLRLRRAVAVAATCAALFVGQVLTLTSDPNDRLSWLSPLGFHVYEAYGELVDTNRELEPEERAQVERWFERNATFHAPAPEHAELFGALAGRDVYVVQVESMEEFVLGLEVEGQEVTPFLNSLLADSLHFTDVVQQTRDGNTSDAELMVTTGLYPLERGSAFLRFPDNDGYTTLPGLVAGQGYRTLAMHGDGATFWNRDRVYPRLGWQDYVSEEDFASAPQVGMGIADSAMFDQALLEQGKGEGPVLMHLIGLTSHTPFELPEDLQELDLSADDMSAHYLQSMRYVDSALADFYAGLEERGLLGRSAIVVLGDHEGIHKYAIGKVTVPDNHERLPFVVHAPGVTDAASDAATGGGAGQGGTARGGAGQRIDTPGGQVDIMPTLAYLLGVPEADYADAVMGRNLLREGSGSGISSEGVLSEGVDGVEQLRTAYEVADLALTSTWFVREPETEEPR
ncbi:LTA synthase family protein [Ornithinimicrobium panacihumi]|uniref:LTA synthase family protein n=1 Tax=Ornithinimicrobium panacihumi TaxID=2008449 RepID=UPI003F8CDF1D